MPYRRLPNTDLARLRALRVAYEKGKELPPFKLAFTQSTLQKLCSNLPAYEKAFLECRQAYNKQVNASIDYKKHLYNLKLYMSHFIQVVNMAVSRGDLKISDREYFGLGSEQNKLPAFNTEANVMKWGKILLDGENRRMYKGLSPVTNPTVALVRVKYENFLESYRYQKTLQTNLKRAQNTLNGLRRTADNIILSIWNEVEEFYKDHPEDAKRNNSMMYGIVYVYRKNEKSTSYAG
jgi:hypothetical protein